MFCPPPEENIKVDNKNLPNRKASRSNRKNKKRIKKNVKRHTKLSRSMSSWAENFTFAATWQLKQQVAFWKARAKALEYENGVLHDVIRRNQCVVKSNTCSDDDDESSTENNLSDQEDAQTDNGLVEDNEEEDNFEVSEQFITFLTANKKYKEDAKRERERLKAQSEAENQENITEETQESAQENMERMRNLYGDKWQRISALEMSLLTNFIQESDQNKPSYWPNIPFNFNMS
ncbi:gem-associated protein 8-like [Danaus plexippus]|uniref:gem-associated protein 8-like n=1 Tax=Danaus plexippus TaxID=13037 RepID=UPI002AB003F5|nr:gem-associated protein 8-like [Danaus plexippus]